MIQIDRYSQVYTDNVIDPLLAFDNVSTWTVTGTGSATVLDTQAFTGSKSLRLQNLAPTTDLTANNTAQETYPIKKTGKYNFTLSLFNPENETIDLQVQLYSGVSLLDTQDINLDKKYYGTWVSFVGEKDYELEDTDKITFKFILKGNAGFGTAKNVFIDGIKFYAVNENVFAPPIYTRPINELYNKYTGWAVYEDGTYTTGSPFTASDGVQIDLPNDKSTTIESQIPIDISTFYDGTVITGREGDGLNITLEFKCRPTTAASNVRLTTTIDIGGAIGELYPRDFFLTKGSLVEHYYLSSFDVYTLDTWEANGGTVKVLATNDDIEIYDIRYVLTRTHKAR